VQSVLKHIYLLEEQCSRRWRANHSFQHCFGNCALSFLPSVENDFSCKITNETGKRKKQVRYGFFNQKISSLFLFSFHDSVTECDVIFFCRDSRILPAIGQQKFSMVELEGPNFIRFFNISDSVVANLKSILQSENYWPEGLISKDSERRASNCQEFKCQVGLYQYKVSRMSEWKMSSFRDPLGQSSRNLKDLIQSWKKSLLIKKLSFPTN